MTIAIKSIAIGASALLFCAALPQNAFAGEISYEKVIAQKSVKQQVVSNFKHQDDSMFQNLLEAPVAIFNVPDDDRANQPNVIFLDQGGVIKGNFGQLTLGRGDVWLSDFSWAGMVGESVSLLPNPEVPKQASDEKLIDGQTTFSCSVRKTVVREVRGVSADTGFIVVQVRLVSGQVVTLSCRSVGGLRVVFMEP